LQNSDGIYRNFWETQRAIEKSKIENMTLEQIINTVKSLGFSPGSYAVFGSGPMAVHGIRETKDIDLIILPKFWDKLRSEGWQEKFLDDNSLYLEKNHVEVYQDWNCGSYNPDLAKLIAESEIIDGVPFVQLNEVLAWKKAQGREKDKKDIELIEKYLRNKHVKLKLYPYNKKFAEIFQKQKEKLIELLGSQEIHHIGSTAVPGLGGKGIIDIMIVLKDWEDEKEIIKKFKSIGFSHVHPKVKGRIFISQPQVTKYGGTHIHLVKKGNRQYKELLFFKNYLIKHKKEAQKYFDLKKQYKKEAKGDRTKYNKFKNRHVESAISKMK
jgi:GrpB-like predicted nucleotidyltransferase (UPF0157 family)